MRWIKKGLLYKAAFQGDWRHSAGLNPTPYLLSEEVIRIYTGFRDTKGRSRIGYVDVEAKNPSHIIQIAKEPILDLGAPGCFDDNGVVPTAVIKLNNKIHLYYAGYQIPTKVKMMIFTGLAISHDGEHFERYQKVPVADRTDQECLFRHIHCLLVDNGVIHVYYGGGGSFIEGQNTTFPSYDIRYMQTTDGFHFPNEYKRIIGASPGEYRLSRPWVIKEDDLYKMFFCAGGETITYKLCYAESENGVDWRRLDDKLNLDLSENGWDSEMMASPAIIKTKYGTYLFYYGNQHGYDGFGYAILLTGEDERKA